MQGDPTRRRFRALEGNNSSSTTENESSIDMEAHRSDRSTKRARPGILSRSLDRLPSLNEIPNFTGILPGRKNQTPSRMIIPIPEDSNEREAMDGGIVEVITTNRNKAPIFLEGTLSFRKCKTSANSRTWRKGYVVFDMRDGGSLSCYKQKPFDKVHANMGLSRPDDSNDELQASGRSKRQLKKEPTARLSDIVADYDDILPKINLPNYVNWVAKDIRHNASVFIIEIQENFHDFPEEERRCLDSGEQSRLRSQPSSLDRISNSAIFHSQNKPPHDLQDDIDRAKMKGQTFRLYFRCSRGGTEKALWLRAFEQMGRISLDLHRQRGIRTLFGNPSLQISHSRSRSHLARLFAKEGRALEAFANKIEEGDDDSAASNHDDPGIRLRQRIKGVGSDTKEFLVYPLYAYPNRWMTDTELYAEMVKPSENFFDLRRPDASQKEIGNLKVEILQCVGLPALDFASETDAVAYMVCGSYAFTSDVIWNRLNPMWLPRSRRACIFPLFHAYARLYVGIFDDDGKGEKDDFGGRVVLDLARCRPRSTYDVTLPLRLSGNVYSRRPRGSVRLRFSFEFYSEREALLSYIPKKLRALSSVRPDDDVTVVCADEKAFRNIATTVHGIHMPGRFSFAEWRATMREANFARKVATNVVRDLLLGIIKWENPSLSFLIFSAWMHCVYKNAFSLAPLYLVVFLLLMMIRSYAFYGSDGSIQGGFIPPSWEELFMALVRGGKSPRIEPLKTRIRRPSRRNLRAGSVRRDMVEARTHKQKGNWLFRLLGFEKELNSDCEPEEYHMEFPYSQGLRHPELQQVHYPKFTVTESLVSKAKSKNKKGLDDEGDNFLGDLMNVRNAASAKMQTRKSFGFMNKGLLKAASGTLDRRKSYPQQAAPVDTRGGMKLSISESSLADPEGSFCVRELPPRLLMPEQNADAKATTKKKKLGDELSELRDNLHKMTFHLFHDRTHRIRRKDACYFGTAHWGRTGQVDNELERLLNVGQYSSANPVVARVGLYVEPIISAAYSGLCLTRTVYNIFTWRDPFLSFWVTMGLLAATIVLAIFPWRLFFFFSGCVVLGPQNYVFRVMEERGTTPQFVKIFLEKRQRSTEERNARKEREKRQLDVPRDQPIITSHTSDNTPPSELTFKDVDPREVHEVCVPYSQLMHHRMYDWPPEAKFASCNPTADVERAAERLQMVQQAFRSSSIRRRMTPSSRSTNTFTSSNNSVDLDAQSRESFATSPY